MKIKNRVLAFSLATVALCGTVATHAIERREYVADVLDVIRTHLDLMQELTAAHKFKYSDNLVRHAVAVERTFGLLGPMEWHAAQAATIRREQEGKPTKLNEDMFESLAKESRNTLRDLVRSAHDSMVEFDAASVNKAITDVKKACENCHRLLPKAVAPDLWGPIPRE